MDDLTGVPVGNGIPRFDGPNLARPHEGFITP